MLAHPESHSRSLLALQAGAQPYPLILDAQFGSVEQVPAQDMSIVSGVQGTTGSKSLYVGNLNYYVDENTLSEIFSTLGRVAECKIIKDKATGLSAGYGFVRFEDHRSADLALQSINGRILYGQEVRVNWAFQKDQQEDTSAHFHIFVGDLSSEVNDHLLKEAFSGFPECSDARVLWDHVTGRSKSYGFVSFRTREAAEHAIMHFNGEFIGHRRVRCGWAQHKQDTAANDYLTVDQSDPTNANVYVGNVAPEVTDAELRRLFQQFGLVLEVKLYRKGSYGFIQYQAHEDAVNAIVSLNGQLVGGKTLKCSWGKHQARQQLPSLAVMPMVSPAHGMLGPQAMVGQQAMLGQQMQHMMMQGPPMQAPQLLSSTQQMLLQQQMQAAPLTLGNQQGVNPFMQQQQQQQLDQANLLYGLYFPGQQ